MKVKTNRIFVPGILALVMLMMCADGILQAQSSVRLTGRVYEEESGTPLGGVNIQLETTVFGTVSDDNGYFSIENVPPGTYSVIFSMLGYEDKTAT